MHPYIQSSVGSSDWQSIQESAGPAGCWALGCKIKTVKLVARQCVRVWCCHVGMMFSFSHVYVVTEACQTHLCTYGAAVMTMINAIIINELLSLLFLEEHDGLNLASTSHTYLKFVRRRHQSTWLHHHRPLLHIQIPLWSILIYNGVKLQKW